MFQTFWIPEFVNAEKFGADVAARAGSIREALKIQINAELYMLQRAMKEDKLSGQVLHARTGNLRNSIVVRGVTDAESLPYDLQSYATPEGSLVGTMGLDSTAWYGKLHEYGGTFQVMRHSAERFSARKGPRGGKRKSHALVTRLMGTYYNVTFPARPWFRPTFDESRGSIRAHLNAAFSRGLMGGTVNA